MTIDEARSLSLYKNNNRDTDPLWAIPLHGFDLNVVNEALPVIDWDFASGINNGVDLLKTSVGVFDQLVDQFNELESEFAQVAAKRREGAEVFVEGCDMWHAVMNEARIYGEVAERIRAILKAHGAYRDLPILPYQR